MGYVLLFLKNMSPQKQTKKVFKSIRDVPSAFDDDDDDDDDGLYFFTR